MLTVIICTLILVLSGLLSLTLKRDHISFKHIIPGAIATVCTFLLIHIIIDYKSVIASSFSAFFSWQLPFANLVFGLDPLSVFFLIPMLILTVSSSLYGPRYFDKHPPGHKHWFFFSTLVAGMILVLLSRNAVMFIISWEVMSLSSFFLVISDKDKDESVQAGWLYFITAHVGTAFLFALFFLLSSTDGSFDFSSWTGITGRKSSVVFLLALAAFGLKAGFIPFHIWLPQAHPAAPSHVSALMSGIMIKMGIYGILRVLTFISPYQAWWGFLLIALGALSGILGVLFATGQHDIKRILAYSSVENIGIILLGTGMGITGVAYGSQTVAFLGFAGALLHVLNHSLFKSLLFLGAGAVIRQTGSGEVDHMGGLIRTMPKTALLFLTGAIAICGLPFFNGFTSELMIYVSCLYGSIKEPQAALAMAGLCTIISLATIGGLAATCFTRLFGTVFLGEPRYSAITPQKEIPSMMLWAMAIPAVLCVLIGMLSYFILPLLTGPVYALAGSTNYNTSGIKSIALTSSLVSGFFLLSGAAVFLIMWTSGKKKVRTETVTWDCGYSRPAPSMQYTSSSFAAPLIRLFHFPVAMKKHLSKSDDLFPASSWKFFSAVEDWFLTGIYTTIIRSFDRAFSSLRWFQSGKAGQYVLYIAVTVICLIIWKFYL
ncbi:MAG: hydrogenase [Fibrobacter sp.]|nr:hydrogenase [Fibrobacter sp.]